MSCSRRRAPRAQCKDMIRRLIRVDELDRLNFDLVLAHPWMARAASTPLAPSAVCAPRTHRRRLVWARARAPPQLRLDA